jgi:hypothetical protein
MKPLYCAFCLCWRKASNAHHCDTLLTVCDHYRFWVSTRDAQPYSDDDLFTVYGSYVFTEYIVAGNFYQLSM